MSGIAPAGGPKSVADHINSLRSQVATDALASAARATAQRQSQAASDASAGTQRASQESADRIRAVASQSRGLNLTV
jgi:hypothetical protein